MYAGGLTLQLLRIHTLVTSCLTDPGVASRSQAEDPLSGARPQASVPGVARRLLSGSYVGVPPPISSHPKRRYPKTAHGLPFAPFGPSVDSPARVEVGPLRADAHGEGF